MGGWSGALGVIRVTNDIVFLEMAVFFLLAEFLLVLSPSEHRALSAIIGPHTVPISKPL
jgi:hypothetical protein